MLDFLFSREVVGGLVSGLALIVLVALIGYAEDVGLFWIVVISIFAFLTALLIVAIFIERFVPRRSGAIKVDLYPHRDSVEWYRSQVANAGRVSVLWNTGSILKDDGVLTDVLRHTDRVILPHPDNPTLEPLAVVADKNGTRDRLVGKIKDVTRFALDAGTEVRWWRGVTGNLITIAPDWILIEQFVPFEGASARPRYRIERRRVNRLYNSLLASYDQMWKNSIPVTQAMVN